MAGVRKSKWTEELVLAEAGKYQSRVEFKRGSERAYRVAISIGVMDEACNHMITDRKSWSKESIHTEALKYTTRQSFNKGCIKAYDAAQARGLLDEVCSHMKSGRHYDRKWTPDAMLKEALKYKTRADFQANSGAYDMAHRKGVLDEICEHMEPGLSGFQKSKPATLYYLKIKTIVGDLYKIGVTNRSVEDRFRGEDTALITVLAKFSFAKGSDCYKAEQSILGMYSHHKYQGEPVLMSGNTELFTENVLGYI